MMSRFGLRSHCLGLLALFGLVLAPLGCQTCPTAGQSEDSIPRELTKVSLPSYRIEPPDILEIDALSLVPKPPYHIAPLDLLFIQASVVVVPEEPINGVYGVQPNGVVNLGFRYGTVEVAGKTLEEAQKAVQDHLKAFVKNSNVTLSLVQSRAMQQIRGEHLVAQDGTVNLGLYGLVSVVGLTVPEAQKAIEQQMSAFVVNPEISVSVSGYNSKVYYVIFDNGGYGEQIARFPIQGGETVLDALALLNGLPPQASLKNVWVARPAPPGFGCDQMLPVDLVAITKRGETGTNYQLLPHDRLYVQADCLVATDNAFNKLIAPIERVFGITLLGTETLHGIKFFNSATAGVGAGVGGF
jgi:polysaccharide biosynthesis/export protein